MDPNDGSNAASEYTLHFNSSNTRRKQLDYCPAVLRKEGTSIAKARELGVAGPCAPYIPTHPQSRWLQLNTVESINHAERILQTPGGVQTPSSEYGNSSSLLSPLSPGSAMVANASPQGTLLPFSQWQPDAQVSTCQARDCSVSFAPTLSSSSARQDAMLSPSSSIFGGLISGLAHPFTARRHHCRACGKIYCSSHSSQTLPLQCNSAEQAEIERSKSVASGAASPLLSLAGLARRGSTPAMTSGKASPVVSPNRDSPYFDFPSKLSPTKSDLSNNNLVVQARVCDDCHISLTVAASLAGIEISRQRLSASGALSPRSSGPSMQASPQQSQTLSSNRLDSLEASSSSASSSSRTRQESASTTASSSGISLPGAGLSTAKSSPPTSRDVSPSALTYKPGNPVRLALPEYRGQTTQVQTKEQPQGAQNRRIYQLSGNQQPAHASAGSSGTPEDGSFPSTIGSTPGQGWTWSTF